MNYLNNLRRKIRLQFCMGEQNSSRKMTFIASIFMLLENCFQISEKNHLIANVKKGQEDLDF